MHETSERGKIFGGTHLGQRMRKHEVDDLVHGRVFLEH